MQAHKAKLNSCPNCGQEFGGHGTVRQLAVAGPGLQMVQQRLD